MAVFEFASFWGVRLQKLAKIGFQDSLEEAASMLLKLLNRARFETAELCWSTLRDVAELLDYGLERGQKAQIVCHDFLLFD